jgi:hypothetical protein
MNIVEIKKELYKTKAMAKLSHYIAGNLYYHIELWGETYKFPISTVEKYCKVSDLIDEPEGDESMDGNFYVLSEDLGTTEFLPEVRGSELARWIQMAIKSEEFLPII